MGDNWFGVHILLKTRSQAIFRTVLIIMVFRYFETLFKLLETIMEIERKFLVSELPPNLDSYPKTSIKQWYITSKPAVRLRDRDGTYTFTAKSKGHLVRQEFEMVLTKEEFDNLFTKVSTHAIDKVRYEIDLGNELTAELDIFAGNHEGLYLVEVEFTSEEAAHAFVPPAWFGEDVTQDAQYKNNNLAISL